MRKISNYFHQNLADSVQSLKISKETDSNNQKEADYILSTVSFNPEKDPETSNNKYTSDSKPIQPDIRFPTINHRSFNIEWYKEFSWVEYSISKDAAYCFVCRHFSTGKTDFNEFRCWSNATKRFRKHKNTEKHKTTIESLEADHFLTFQEKLHSKKAQP